MTKTINLDGTVTIRMTEDELLRIQAVLIQSECSDNLAMLPDEFRSTCCELWNL